ncbi:hypothetical protein K8I85_10900, partial [bacterium]|nr:hypothetical protein [bacterium]
MRTRIARLAPAAVLLLLTALAGSAAAEKVEFRFDPDGKPKAVYLAGDFNNWNPAGNALSDPAG